MSFGIQVLNGSGVTTVDENSSVPLIVHTITVPRGGSGSYTVQGFQRAFAIGTPIESRNQTFGRIVHTVQMGRVSSNGNVISWNNNYVVQIDFRNYNVNGLVFELTIFGAN